MIENMKNLLHDGMILINYCLEDYLVVLSIFFYY